jgi:hypothetical protein
MARRLSHQAAIVLALALALPAPAAIPGDGSARTPAARTPHFAFYSDFATNLNDALIAAGVARNRHKPELFQSGDGKPCFDALPPSARAAWNRAVDYYAEIISPAEWSDRQQHLIRVDLCGFEEELRDAAARQFVAIARDFRSAAGPAYQACRWPAQDAKNRRWIEDLKPRLTALEPKIARRLEALYQKPWSGLPIPVDVVETVNWSGANSIIRSPAGGHLLISNSYQGPAALEVVFHEASHLLADRGDPFRKALDDAAKALGLTEPDDLWHVVLFYTTGEAVRRILSDAGEKGYNPMVNAIFERSKTWAGYRPAIEKTWPAYLDGKRTLPEAAADLLRALHEKAGPAS